MLEGLFGALLGILQERHQQEGDEGGRGVDDELVGVEVADQEVGGRSQHHQKYAEGEKRCSADEIGAPIGEPVEERATALFPGLRHAAAFAHALPLLRVRGLSLGVNAPGSGLPNGTTHQCQRRPGNGTSSPHVGETEFSEVRSIEVGRDSSFQSPGLLGLSSESLG
jgi:hypothetical protein